MFEKIKKEYDDDKEWHESGKRLLLASTKVN